jgi:ribokinase
MKKSGLIVNAGSINMDLIVRSPRIPKPGETIIGSSFFTAPGGKGANQSVAAARAGGQVSHIGRVGKDDFGSALLSTMVDDKVNCDNIFVDADHATGVALIVVEDSGENSIVVASGANMQVSPEDVEKVKDQISSAEVLLLQLEIPIETVIFAASIAHQGGCRVLLNPAPAQSLPPELLQNVDILIPNESETHILTGLPVEDDDQLRAAATSLLDFGVETVILTMGQRGALLIQRNQTTHVPAFKVDPVDTTAAGDAFVGAFAAGLAQGESLEQAVVRGNAAGALAATKLGAQPSLPTRENIDRLLSAGIG